MGEDKRFVVQAAIFSQKTSSNCSVSSAGNRSIQSEYRGQRRRSLRQRLMQSQTVGISKQICLLFTRRQVVHKVIGVSLVLYLIFHINNASLGDEAGDIAIPTTTVKKQQQPMLRLSSFLDMSWATWGKDTTQFETLLPPSEMDFSIDRRLPWYSEDEETDYCDDVLLFMPYQLAIGGNGQGSQLNNYLLASLVATYLNKALVILEPPRDFNRFSQGSQFGCPADPYKQYGRSTRFPDGLQRMIQHPHFISRGCRVPCQGSITYKDWEIKRQSQIQHLKNGELHHEECKEASRHIKVMPVGGYDLRELFHRSLRNQMVDRSSPNYDPRHAHSWAMRLGAKPHEAEVFTTLSNASDIWDFLSALMSRSGLLRFQPWIARDVAEYIRSSNLPTDVSYDAIHVRRGDKLKREATKEVNNYWLERGYKPPFPTNYIPFAHYIERGWDGVHAKHCKRIKTHGTVHNRLGARLVYIATDDPATVRKEIDELPNAKGGNTIAGNCYRLRFIFSPAAQEDGTVYHLNSRGFHDDCKDRYMRNIQAIADLMILTKSEMLIADFNSNWGSLIRNFRTVLNDNVELQLDRDTDEPAVFIRDMVLAFGPQDRRPLEPFLLGMMGASLLAVLLTASSIDASSMHETCRKGSAGVYSFAQFHRGAFLDHSIDLQCSQSLAFASPHYGVAASLFNRNFLGKRRRPVQKSNVFINHGFVRGKCCRGMNIFMGQPSAALVENESGISEQDPPSRSQQILQSLQGGADISKDISNQSADEAYQVATVDPSEQSSSDKEISGSNSDEDDDDTKLLIHIFPYDDPIGNDNNCTAMLNETNNIPLLYKQAMLVGLGVSRSQFAMGVYYHLNSLQNNDINYSGNAGTMKMQLTNITNRIQTHNVDWETDWSLHRPTLLDLWKQGRLFCESTGLLSPKKFRSKRRDYNSEGDAKLEEEDVIFRGENFRDALASYAERFVSIVNDELSDVRDIVGTNEGARSFRVESNIPKWNDSKGLLGWVEKEYGSTLMASSLLLKSESEQLKELKAFLTWFRERFPYYHDKCLNIQCGAMCKDSPSGDDSADQANSENQIHPDEEDDVSFVGYVFPTHIERLGNASRTELYRCRSCNSFTRFPRYNKALWITTTRRGRCGEYSMLMYRILRSLGYKKLRWVVDWADHVWVDIRLGDSIGTSNNSTYGRWVHCDPCEASIDEPLLYEGWGKNQTYIVAFYDPFNKNAVEVGDLSDRDHHVFRFPLIEDVTAAYTTDNDDVVIDRRGIGDEFIAETIREVSRNLTTMLNQTSALPAESRNS